MNYFALENIIKPATSDIANIFINGDFPLFSYTILVYHNKIPFWNYHKRFFKIVAQQLEAELPDYFDSYKDFITRLVNKNKFYNGALLKVIFYPVNERLRFIALPQKYDITKAGFSQDKVVVYDNQRLIKHIDKLSFIRQYCAHHSYIYNKRFAKLELIHSQDGRILETQLGNILIRKEDYIIAPNYKCGAFYNAFYQYLIDILTDEFNYQVRYELIDMKSIENADEVWIVTWNSQIIYRVGVNRFRYDKRLLKEQIESKVSKLFDGV